jgi:two-component system, response regulator / RNA-binding antiterminator
VTVHIGSSEFWPEPAPRCARVLIAGPAQITRPLAAALDPDRYSVAARFESLAYLAEGIAACEPDSVVVAFGGNGHDGIDVCASITSAQPTVIWDPLPQPRRIEKALGWGAAGYVVGETDAQRINAILLVASIRFEQQRALRDDLARTRQALADRKIIDRAKGVLMEQRKLSEDEAYHFMRRMAMNRGKRLSEVAQAILNAPEALQAL